MDAKQRKEMAKLSFEQALERLEAVMGRMEDGKSPLDQMMRDFEEGNALADICGRQLKAVEKKIEMLVKDDGGDGRWQDFPGKDADGQDVVAPENNEEDGDGEGDSLF